MAQQRIIVVGVVYNQLDEILICKMPPTRGVFPGQWGLPGGGLEAGETLEMALRRELREEIGIEVTDIQAMFFTDGQYTKTFPGGDQQEMYMVFLVFTCRACSEIIKLNAEFERYTWTSTNSMNKFDLNVETRKTFQRIGVI